MLFNSVVRGGSGGGGGDTNEPSDVNFYDYDGTLVKSYKSTDFANLSALPDNPSHTGLTAQGWNWSLSDAKAFVATYGKLDIGQMYVTASGDTEIDISIQDTLRMSPYLGIAVDGTVEIDWGDNSTDTVTGSSVTTRIATLHNYAATGDYTITLSVQSGRFSFYETSTRTTLGNNTSSNGSQVYMNMIQAVRIGNNAIVNFYAFHNCIFCKTVTIPNGVTTIGTYAFRGCSSLAQIIIPNSVTTIDEYAFFGCSSLENITIPNSVTTIGSNAFKSCSSLKNITIPNSVTTIDTYAFSGCSLLENITIPNSVTTIGSNAFEVCGQVKTITLSDNLTNIYIQTFMGDTSIKSVIIPSSVTKIADKAFLGCTSLQNITIPNGVTNIGIQTFSNCYSLTHITIPSSVTKIGITAFANNEGMKEYHFQPTTPPTITNTNVFSNIPSDCIIYVPQASVNAYKTANYWSTYASKIVGE